MSNQSLDAMPVWGWILLAIALLSQSLWLYTDARKRNKNRWFWGIWGLFNVPTVSIIYAILCIYLPHRKAKKQGNVKM